MISVDVRSWNVRPSASMPVTVSGTACTIRVVRRFCASMSGLGMDSDTPTPSISSLTPRTAGVERGTDVFPNSYGKNQHLLAYVRGSAQDAGPSGKEPGTAPGDQEAGRLLRRKMYYERIQIATQSSWQ